MYLEIFDEVRIIFLYNDFAVLKEKPEYVYKIFNELLTQAE